MKALWSTLVVILFSFTMVMEEAHAKRMGGGKSFGRSYQSAPAPARNTADAPAQRQQADAAKPAQQPGAAKGGLMGGLLGGLLVGGDAIQPAGVAAMLQGVILFVVVGGEMLLTYRVRLEKVAVAA